MANGVWFVVITGVLCGCGFAPRELLGIEGLHINQSPRVEIDAVATGHKFRRDRDHFKLLELDGSSLLVGARDAVYNLSLARIEEQQTLSWKPSDDAIEQCKNNGKTEHECHNFIRVLVRQSRGYVLVCGTNAFKPLCREYSLEVNGGKEVYQIRRRFSGYAISPYDPKHNSTFLYLPEMDELYAATVSDFAASDPLIYRKPLSGDSSELRTPRNDLKCLNDPNFVSSSADHEHVYFWFREVAVEYSACGKGVFARVGRVCKRDQGGPRSHKDTWTSFVKARLNCSIPGDYPFYFDELQATSGLITGANGDSIVYGVFTTLWEGLHASAVCAYSMRDIRRIFDYGAFKVQRNPQELWFSVPKRDLPIPRPGSCSPNSKHLNDDVVNFIKKNSLMEQAVPNVFNQPLLIDTSLKIRYVQVTVDGGVKAVNGQQYDVIFVGTDNGRVLKLVNVASARHSGDVRTVVIETIRLFQASEIVRNLLVSRVPGAGHSGRSDDKLIAVTDSEVHSIPLHRCGNVSTCTACVRLQDPYCAWDKTKSKCIGRTDGLWLDSSEGHHDYVQEVPTGRSAGCPDELWSRQSISKSLKTYSKEQMAIAVVLTLTLAALLGFACGYKFSRLRQQEQPPVMAPGYGYSTGGNHPAAKPRLTVTSETNSPATNHLDFYSSPPGYYQGKPNEYNHIMYNSLHEPVFKSEKASPLILNNGTLPKDYKVKKVYL